MIETAPSPGQIVHVRARPYLVESRVDPPSPGDATLVRLSCLDDDALGEPLEVLWEKELDARPAVQASRDGTRAFDAPALFSAYLHALRWGAVTSTNPKLFQAPYRAGIEVMAYQLEPLRKALLLPHVNLFIADDVGLGKTIEAALVMRELMMRQKVRRVVVACPPSVVLQWQSELEQRFGLRFVVYDRDFLQEKRRERGWGTNPFTTHSRFIVSHALLRDETHASLLRDWITNDDHLRPEQREPALFVLDEAHNAAPASGSKYAIDSKFTRVVRELAPLFEHRLFLSATPHNGHSNSFSALLEILDPARFCRGVRIAPKQLETVMVRRLKSDLRGTGLKIPERRVVQIDVDGLPDDAPELVLAQLLDDYRKLREARVASATKRQRNAATIVVIALQKRLLSSIEAFACTLAVHERAVLRAQAERRAQPAQLLLTEIDDEEDLSEDEQRVLDEDAVEAAALASLSAAELDERERALLARMRAIADDARGLPDGRVERLLAWIREHVLAPDARRYQPRRVLVFTEYTDTKRYLVEQLASALSGTDRESERVGVFHGGMDDEAREAIKRAFNEDPKRHPLRVLVATDAAREGVNLQNHCADLFHFDVPWNPSRMEQRNGRIDRKLQRADEVRCHYFVYVQRPEDRVLAALVKKTRAIEEELGSLSPVVEARLSRALEGGIKRDEADALAATIASEALDEERTATVREELEAPLRAAREERAQKLHAQHAVLQDMMAAAKEALAFDEAEFRDVLSTALSLHGVPPLAPAGTSGAYSLAIEGTALARDPSWQSTLDLLRKPRARGEKLWDWRRASPLRPVVFRDSGSLDEDFVHLHLEHRLAQRLLGRFSSQGFLHDDLARATALVSNDPIPRVVLLGRLALHGEGAARLHDEILAIAARVTEPGTLKPYAGETTEKTLRLVDEALTAARPIPKDVQARLRARLEQDEAALRAPLESVADERAGRAVELLGQRADREAAEMRALLHEQKKHLEQLLRDEDDPQLLIGFDEQERRQRDADRRHWQKRLAMLTSDLEDEPARIRRVYDVRARRLEPVGLIYLWPRTG